MSLPTNIDAKRRFEAKFDRLTEDACWPWKAARSQDGYGLFWYNGRVQNAHRVHYEILHGPIPPTTVVMHLCDNPICVNPSHLQLGTHQENAQDRTEKGRQSDRNGHRNGRSKLSHEDAEEIISLLGVYTQQELADMYGVTQSTISKISLGRTWSAVL